MGRLQVLHFGQGGPLGSYGKGHLVLSQPTSQPGVVIPSKFATAIIVILSSSLPSLVFFKSSLF